MRIAIAAILLMMFAATLARAGEITVSAAVSLKEAMTDVAAAYQQETGRRVRLNFGATGHLLAQIRDGAPVDGFVSAAEAHMDQAAAQRLIDPPTRVAIAGSRLVLIVPADAKRAPDGFRALGSASIRRLAIGQPRTVPAGQYAEQALRKLALLESVRGRLVHGGSVRQVLDYVERGEVDAGIVYATDARQSGAKVRVVATAEQAWHEPILYSAATVRGSAKKDDAGAFWSFLTSEAGQKILAAHGFAPSTKAPPSTTTSPATPRAPAASAAPAAAGKS
jgi:molybdate transport system substrate-binding protein